MKTKIFFILFIAVGLMLSVYKGNAGDHSIADPMIGKTVTLQSALLIVADSPSISSVTARKINRIGHDLVGIFDCAGCHHETEQLVKVLIKGQHLTIIDAYKDIPSFLAINKTTVKYFIAKTEDMTLVVSETALQHVMDENGAKDQKMNRYNKLLESFGSEEELKDFYINVTENMRPMLFPNANPPYDDHLIEQHYKWILNGLADYGAQRGEFNRVLCGFPVTVSRRALAFIMLNSANLYIDISPYQKL